MQLRRFTADSTPAALGAVRLALGDDAIILANRKIGDQVEIIATGQMEDAQSLAEISLASVSQQTPSPDEELIADIDSVFETDPTPELAGNAQVAVPAMEELSAAMEVTAGMREHAYLTEAAESSSQDLADEAVSKAPVRRNGSGVPKNFAHSASSRQSASSDYTDAEASTRKTSHIREQASQPSGRKQRDASHLNAGTQTLTSDIDQSVARHTDQLARIIEAQGVMLDKYFKGLEVNLWGNSAPNRTLHLQRLLAMGIGAELAIQLVERADPAHSVEDALRESFALLKSTLPIGVDKTFVVPGVTILSGPPGAGKTTALMKIATQHVKEHGNDSIVVICADTRRIGAFEELQAYGRLLGVPTVHAHDSSELDSLLNAFTHKQLVLIDHTLPMDDDAVEIPRCLLKPVVADSVRQLLVLSATSQSSTVDALIHRHCEGRSMQCILTNLDANARLGEMFNATIRHHLPIAYWSDTASIQTPLQKADASVLIATAVAMSRRIRQTPDDEWLLRLVQPTDKMMTQPIYKKKNNEVSA
ncbi:MAG: hypothetical protein AB8B97_03290 [Granulosicoccus sp.]